LERVPLDPFDVSSRGGLAWMKTGDRPGFARERFPIVCSSLDIPIPAAVLACLREDDLCL